MNRRYRASTCLAAFGAIAASTITQAQTPRDTLPIEPAPFTGTVTENILDSTPDPQLPVRAPEGAPNIIVFMSDDTGFSMSSAFGGPVPTPNYDRLARQGQRYNNFHTTGVCSPSRAALLTGRNHHRVGMGHVPELSTGFPGYTGRIPREAATIAQVLRLNGYNTAMFGKHHNVPQGEGTMAGPFDHWPTGLGFEYFYGFITADTDQYDPAIIRGTDKVDPDEGKGRLLDRRLAEDAIKWLHNHEAAAPDKPFFIYYAPATLHAPHQVPAEYIDRFKGRFDQGWDALRKETWHRQLAMGIIPKGTVLTPRPAQIPAWDSLSDHEKSFAARSMEVAAAVLAYQDEQFGRVLDELERMGRLDDTLILLSIGDNGASMEAGPSGTLNETYSMTGGKESPEWLYANMDKLGGPMVYGNYPVGWAWALDTPLRWGKMYTSMLGATRNGMIARWGSHIAKKGSVCGQFSHVIDIMPTVLDAAKVPAPKEVYGADQMSLDGESLIKSFTSCTANQPRTQYFEVGGKIGLYHNGWFLSGDDKRVTWEGLPPDGPRPPVDWALYNLQKDFSQSTDVAVKYPDKFREMQALWQQEAQRNQVYPLDHRFGFARFAGQTAPKNRERYDYWGKGVSVPAGTNPAWTGQSFTLTADITTAKPDASGVIMAVGSHFGGWSLMLDQGRPTFVYAASTNPDHIVRIASQTPVKHGQTKLQMRFDFQGFAKGAIVTLSQTGKSMASGQVNHLFLSPSGLGETVDVGRDLGVPVTSYSTHRGEFEGDIKHVLVEFNKDR